MGDKVLDEVVRATYPTPVPELRASRREPAPEDDPALVRELLARLPPDVVKVALLEAARVSVSSVAPDPAQVYAHEAGRLRAWCEELERENEALRAAAKVPMGTPLSEPGKAGFDAYNEYRGGKTHDGRPTPPWEELGDGVRTGWVCAAIANIGALVPSQAKMVAELVRQVAELGDCEDSQNEDACGGCRACLRVALADALRQRGEALAALDAAPPPGSKLEVEKRARARFVAEVQCLRRWYGELVADARAAQRVLPGALVMHGPPAPPSANDLFGMYPDLAPKG